MVHLWAYRQKETGLTPHLTEPVQVQPMLCQRCRIDLMSKQGVFMVAIDLVAVYGALLTLIFFKFLLGNDTDSRCALLLRKDYVTTRQTELLLVKQMLNRVMLSIADHRLNSNCIINIAIDRLRPCRINE